MKVGLISDGVLVRVFGGPAPMRLLARGDAGRVWGPQSPAYNNRTDD